MIVQLVVCIDATPITAFTCNEPELLVRKP